MSFAFIKVRYQNVIYICSDVKIRLFRSASPPQEDVCQRVEDDVNDSHEDDVGPEIALVKVVLVQYVGALGKAG